MATLIFPAAGSSSALQVKGAQWAVAPEQKAQRQAGENSERLDDISTALNQSFPGAVMSQPGVAGGPRRTAADPVQVSEPTRPAPQWEPGGSRGGRAPHAARDAAGRAGEEVARVGAAARGRVSQGSRSRLSVLAPTHARPSVRGKGPAAGPDSGDSPFAPHREFPARAAPACARLFRTPTFPWDRPQLPGAALGRGPARAPGSLAPHTAARRPPGAGRGAPWGPAVRLGPLALSRASLGPEPPGRLRERGGALSLRPSLGPRPAAWPPTWLPGRTRAAAGGAEPRATRAAAGVGRTAARAAPTLPPESGVEHSASPRGANEQHSGRNSTTYLRARNGRAPALPGTPGPPGPIAGARPSARWSLPRPGTPGAARWPFRWAPPYPDRRHRRWGAGEVSAVVGKGQTRTELPGGKRGPSRLRGTTRRTKRIRWTTRKGKYAGHRDQQMQTPRNDTTRAIVLVWQR
ncbi:translation initiation factor IF-2 [Oryctolagus cuniculus]|uniref:translation initiation factor IF-2 n=1 Tax=Oryctolagus cuniculus TaxID=9986 RepID=UPI00387A1DDE